MYQKAPFSFKYLQYITHSQLFQAGQNSVEGLARGCSSYSGKSAMETIQLIPNCNTRQWISSIEIFEVKYTNTSPQTVDDSSKQVSYVSWVLQRRQIPLTLGTKSSGWLTERTDQHERLMYRVEWARKSVNFST